MTTLHLSYQWRRFIAYAIYTTLNRAGLSEQVEQWASDILIDLYTAETPGGNMAIGTIVAWPNTTLPSTMLPCEGNVAYNRVDYPDLYDVLDDAFHLDADHFVTPDLRGRVVIGVDSGYHLATTGGESEHTLTIAEMPAHAHTAGGKVSTGNGGWFARTDDNPGTTNPTNETGGGLPHNNMPPYMALRWAIVALDE